MSISLQKQNDHVDKENPVICLAKSIRTWQSFNSVCPE